MGTRCTTTSVSQRPSLPHLRLVGDLKSEWPGAPAGADTWLGLAWRQNGNTCLLHGHPDDVGVHDPDDVQLQYPPQERLQLVEALQEQQRQHCEVVGHQVPIVPQICKAGRVCSCEWKPGLYRLLPQFLAHCLGQVYTWAYIEYIFYYILIYWVYILFTWSKSVFCFLLLWASIRAAPGRAAYLTSPPPLHPPRPHPHSRPRCPCQVHPSWLLQGIPPSVSSPGPTSCLTSATSRLAVSFIMARSRRLHSGRASLLVESSWVREGRALGAESEWHMEEDEQNGSHHTAWHVGLLASGCFLFFWSSF